MPDESAQKSGPALPPKLTARKIMPAAAPVVAAPLQPPAPASVAPTVQIPQGVKKDTLKMPVEARSPIAQPLAATPAVPAAASVTPVATALPGIKADRKKDTSKLSLDDARPAPVGAGEPVIKTVRLKPPATMASAGKVEPMVATPVKQPAAPGEAVQGIQSKRKGDTSRIDIDAVVKAPEAATAATAPGGIRTVRIKSGPAVAAFVGTQPIGGVEVKGAKPAAPAAAPKPPATKAPVESVPPSGPATIRLKKPDGLKQGAVSHVGGETARISIDTPAVAPDAQGDGGAGDQAAPRTVRIKRPDGSAAPAEQEASPVTGRKTMKISRPGQPAGEQPGQEAKSEEAPLTQRRTLSIKRQEEKATDRSIMMAEQEAALMGKKGAKGVPGERPPERFAWAWCIVSVAAMIVIGCVMWVFWVQLNPRIERKFDVPHKILSFNDPFYRDERGWL